MSVVISSDHHPITYFEDLREGMSAEYKKFVTQRDIELFAELSGDDNPIHLDEDYAKKTIFKRRVAHGLLTASFISAVIGGKLPGPGCIYISQSLNFRSALYAGDEVVAQAKVLELHPERYRATFCTSCKVGSRTILEGEALIQVPSRADL